MLSEGRTLGVVLAGFPALKRTFSRTSNSPSDNFAARVCALSPTVSPAKVTGNEGKFSETIRGGLERYFASGSPLDDRGERPQSRVRQRRWRRSKTGSDARMRPSSVTFGASSLLSGTFRSERTRMRRPATPSASRSSRVRTGLPDPS